MKNSTKIKAGLLLTSLACAAGATAALVLLQKKREEEVYHEAELKAMDELEEMMREDPAPARRNVRTLPVRIRSMKRSLRRSRRPRLQRTRKRKRRTTKSLSKTE